MKSASDQIRRLRTELRPQALLEARSSWKAGHLPEARAANECEDEAIFNALHEQTATHQEIFVDGEFRRTGFMTGFPVRFVEDTSAPIEWKGGTGTGIGPYPRSALIYDKGDYEAGIAALRALGYDDNADVATLLGYASRKLSRYDDANKT